MQEKLRFRLHFFIFALQECPFRVHRIRIDAQIDVAENVGFWNIERVQTLQISLKSTVLFVTIVVAVALLTIAEVVGNVVVGRQLVGINDTLVDQLRHLTMILVVRAVLKLT